MIRLILLLALLPSVAMAHGWYPISCCYDHDCKRVPCEEILETPTGYLYDGVPFAKSAMKPSQDRWCHVCIFESKGLGGKTDRNGRCLFTIQGT